MGVDPGLFDLMVQSGKDSIRILSTQELARLNVANNGRKKAEWSIEVFAGGEDLRGAQETVYGLGKAFFICRTHNLHFFSFYQAGNEQANSIASGGWFHSLLLDGKPVSLPSPISVNVSGNELQTEFALTRQQALAITSASSVGHAMQLGRGAPVFVGFSVDIPPQASQKVSTFINNCLAPTH
jgi:hypothetical protein